MNEVQIHLALNHFPVVGLILGTLVLCLSLLLKSEVGTRIGFMLLVLICIIAIPTYLSGGAAEELVEDMVGFDHDTIHQHEEAAESFIVAIAALGLLSLASLILGSKKNKLAKTASIATVILAIICCALAVRVGHTGGLIRHPELTTDAVPVEKSASEKD